MRGRWIGGLGRVPRIFGRDLRAQIAPGGVVGMPE